MKKKVVSMALVGIMMMSTLAGCGKGGNSEPEKTADGKRSSRRYLFLTLLLRM